MTGAEPSPAVLASLSFAERLANASSEGLLAFDREFRYVFWNPVMERITGFKKGEVLGQDARRVFPFLREGESIANYERVLGGESVAVNDRAFTVPETGRKGHFDGSGSPLVVDGSEILGGVGVIRDITRRKLIEEKLNETESRFQRMADTSPVLLWMSGTDSLCHFFNQTWLKFTGKPMREEIGVGWAEGVHPEDFQRCMDTYELAFRAREEFEMEYRLARADGQFRWILDRGAPRFNPGGEFAGYIGSCVDITELKSTESALREAVQARDEFLAIASHELKTPLTSLKLQVQMFRYVASDRSASPIPPERLRRVIETSERQIGRLATLIDDLLDVSRLKSGRPTLHREELDLDSLVKEAVGRLSHQLTEAGCHVAIAGRDRPVRGRWDRARIEQVLVNLLTNVIKYADHKPVEISVFRGPGMAGFSVLDHGIGIDPKALPLVFDRFERAVSSEHYGGLGLGLYISKQIVLAHGGSIYVESELGLGSKFTVILPLSA